MANVQHLVELTTALLKEQKADGSYRTLYEEGWRVMLTRANRQAGVCKHRSKRIGLSANLMPAFTDDSAWNTATHEVAHAIVGVGHGHDHVWKQAHLRLGGSAERLYTNEAFSDGVHPREHSAPIVGTCPSGHTHHRYKMPRHEVSCGRCSRRFDKRFLIKWERR